MPRFQIDEKSVRGAYSLRADVRLYTVLVDGQDRGIIIRTGDYQDGSSAVVHGETVVSGLPSIKRVLEWLEANLADLPRLRTEQLEMEI